MDKCVADDIPKYTDQKRKESYGIIKEKKKKYQRDGDQRDYGGINCGEVFEFRLREVGIPARVEMGMDRKWYLVGLPGLKLDGLEVRV